MVRGTATAEARKLVWGSMRRDSATAEVGYSQGELARGGMSQGTQPDIFIRVT